MLNCCNLVIRRLYFGVSVRYEGGVGNTVEENSSVVSSPKSECGSCLQCFDSVG